MATLKSSIADELRRLIENEDNNLRVAEATGIPRTVIIRFRRGEQGINLSTAEKLFAYFGLDMCRRPKGRS